MQDLNASNRHKQSKSRKIQTTQVNERTRIISVKQNETPKIDTNGIYYQQNSLQKEINATSNNNQQLNDSQNSNFHLETHRLHIEDQMIQDADKVDIPDSQTRSFGNLFQDQLTKNAKSVILDEKTCNIICDRSDYQQNYLQQNIPQKEITTPSNKQQELESARIHLIKNINMSSCDISNIFGDPKKKPKVQGKKRRTYPQKISNSQQLIQDIQVISRQSKKEQCIICQKSEFEQNQNQDGIKQLLLVLCSNFQYPITQQIADYIKKITGKIMYEDIDTYHKQYDTGLMINLNHQVFDYQKLNDLLEFIIQILINDQQNKSKLNICEKHTKIDFQTQSSHINSSLQQQWLQNYQQQKMKSQTPGRNILQDIQIFDQSKSILESHDIYHTTTEGSNVYRW